MKLAHPFGITSGEEIIHGHDVYAATRQAIQIRRQGCDERLSLTGLHLGDATLVKNDSADHLHVVVALPK